MDLPLFSLKNEILNHFVWIDGLRDLTGGSDNVWLKNTHYTDLAQGK